MKFVPFALTTFFPRQLCFAESCSILMNFGTHILEVTDQLYAYFHFLKLHLTRDFFVGSRVGRASRDFCAFSFDHFVRRQPFYPKSCSICLKFGTYIMEVIDQITCRVSTSYIPLGSRFFDWKQSRSSISLNLCFLFRPLFSSLTLSRWKLFDLDEI